MEFNETLMKTPIRGLIYAQSGGGKTSLLGRLAQFEQARPIYIFDWDLRIGSLAATLPKDYWQYVHTDQYRDTNIGGEAFILMQSKLAKLEKEGFKTVIIDSFTFAMRGMMARVLRLDGKTISDIPQIQNYLAQQTLAEEIISQGTSKSFNFFITCHEDVDKDEMTGRLFKNIALTGKSATRLPGYFNELWHCEMKPATANENAKYMVRVKSDGIFNARTTYRSLNPIEPQEDIWRKIFAERANQAKPS